MKTIVKKIPNPTRRDSIVYGAYLAKMGISGLGNAVTGFRKRGLRKTMDNMRRYPWLLSLMNFKFSYDMITIGRTGLYREANAMILEKFSQTFSEVINGFVDRPEETVLIEDAVPSEIVYGMGLNPWIVEFAGMMIPAYSPKRTEDYIDAAENEGMPPDLCSMVKVSMGMILEHHLPDPVAVLTSNMPCDGGMSQYALVERELKAPTFYLDSPYDFYSERAVDYYVGQLKQMIAWLEEHTPGRMDWDRMREICDQRNRTIELQLELWDLLRVRPAPMAAETIFQSNIVFGLQPGNPRGTKLHQRLLEMAKQNLRKGKGALIDERYRMALWNPMPAIFLDIYAWSEQAYGVALLMDMITFHRHPFVDTRTPDTMLRDLAKIMMQVGMARHTRGPAENFFGDLFYIYEHFDLDMLWIAGHIGCKNTQALFGMLREKCRERDIPLFIMDADLLDARIVSPEGIRKQIEQFMETVMNAERLQY